jgi:hypothetical protein
MITVSYGPRTQGRRLCKDGALHGPHQVVPVMPTVSATWIAFSVPTWAPPPFGPGPVAVDDPSTGMLGSQAAKVSVVRSGSTCGGR